MSVVSPPRRPYKSRLRKTISISQISDPIPIDGAQSPISSTDSPLEAFSTDDFYSKLRVTSPIPSHNALQITEKSRFVDQSLSNESLRSSEDSSRTDIKKYNTGSMKGSRSLTTSLRDSLSPPSSVHDTEETKSTDKSPISLKLKSSNSTPLQLPKGVPRLGPRRFGSNGSLVVSKAPTASSHIKNNSSTSVNRAQVIIQRLENWHSLLKAVISWLEEASKLTMASSRGFAVRAYTLLNGDDNEHNINHSFYSTLQELTMQLAAEQQEVSNSLEHEFLPDLVKLRKECKDKIQKLKADPSLLSDELLRRAEVTRAKMTHLDRCCKQADKTNGQVEMDPWLANLLVLQQLKKELEEENRLRSLMVPIQKDAKSFEKKVIEAIKPAIEYCYKAMLPQWENTSYKNILDKIMPDHEWVVFCEEKKSELVDEKNVTKDYMKFNYPNKFNPLVMTLLKGTMEKKTTVRKQYSERYYVLSKGGYLHEFNMDDKVNPERSFYIPSVTIVPSIDIHLKRSTSEIHPASPAGESYTFEICKPSTAVLQRDKISVFRTKTREDLVKWCGLLVHIASGISLSAFGLTNKDGILNHSVSSEAIEEQPTQPSLINKAETKSRENDLKAETKKTNSIHTSTSVESIKSVLTEESFNEPAAMKINQKQVEPKRFLESKNDVNETEEKKPQPNATHYEEEINVADIYNAMDNMSFDSAVTIKAPNSTQ